eukprot:359744-Amphidinium_carterae.1
MVWSSYGWSPQDALSRSGVIGPITPRAIEFLGRVVAASGRASFPQPLQAVCVDLQLVQATLAQVAQ